MGSMREMEDSIFHVPKGYEMIIKGFCLGGGLGRKASG